MPSSPTTPGTDESSPLSDFSRCHVGILDHMAALGELPQLLQAAARAREVAAQTLKFFEEVVFDHHSDEEKELFAAVGARLPEGNGLATRARHLIDQLTADHRAIEARWLRLRPAVEAAARGRAAELDATAVADLVAAYQAHARLEEQEFLPLSSALLGEASPEMAELGLSLHMRHVVRDWRRHGLQGS